MRQSWIFGIRGGREGVKERIKDRINDFLYQGQVMEVWFGKLTLQALAGYKE